MEAKTAKRARYVFECMCTLLIVVCSRTCVAKEPILASMFFIQLLQKILMFNAVFGYESRSRSALFVSKHCIVTFSLSEKLYFNHICTSFHRTRRMRKKSFMAAA